MPRAVLVGRDERQVDRRLGHRRELALGALRGLLEPLQRHAVAAQVDPGLAAELLDQPVDDALVEVLAAEIGVAGSGPHLEDALGELEDRDVEGAAAEVVDGDLAVGGAAVEAVGQRRGGRLVQDAQHLEPGDAPGVLGRLTLRIVEVGRDRDDRLAHRFAERLFGERLELAQHEGGDLLGTVLAIADLDLHVAVGRLDQGVGQQIARALDVRIAVLPADQALDREHRLLRVGDRLALGDLPHEPVAVRREGDDRRRRAAAVAVRQHPRREGLDHRDAAVRGAEIDADDLPHVVPFCLSTARYCDESDDGAVVRRLSRHGDLDHRRPQEPVVQPVSALQLERHGRSRDAVGLFLEDGFVDRRVEALAERRNRRQSVALQNLLELPDDHLDTLAQIVGRHLRWPVSSGRARARSRLSTTGRSSRSTSARA